MPIYITQKFEDTSVNNTVADAQQIYDETVTLTDTSGLNGKGAYQSEINDYLLTQLNVDASLLKVKSISTVTTNGSGEKGSFLKIEYSLKNKDTNQTEEKTFYSPNILSATSTISNDDIDNLF